MSGIIASSFLTSALEGGEWSASPPCCCIPRETAPGTDWTEGWMGPTADMDIKDKRKISRIMAGIKKNLL
jgi:hypothetical protein